MFFEMRIKDYQPITSRVPRSPGLLAGEGRGMGDYDGGFLRVISILIQSYESVSIFFPNLTLYSKTL